MKKLKHFEQWKYHFLYKHVYLTDNDDIMASYTVGGYPQPSMNKSFRLEELYIQPKFRGIGLAHILMKDIINEYGHKTIYLYVTEEDTIVDFYIGYDFRFIDKYHENRFRYMIRLKNKKLR
jgi:ribosomal protein S18 acetylase RimI-like enzyme